MPLPTNYFPRHPAYVPSATHPGQYDCIYGTVYPGMSRRHARHDSGPGGGDSFDDGYRRNYLSTRHGQSGYSSQDRPYTSPITPSDRRNEYTGQHSSLHRSSAVRRTDSNRYRGYPDSGRPSTDSYRRVMPAINTSTSASASRYRWPLQSSSDDFESPISRRGSTFSTAWNDDRPEHGRTGSVRSHRYPVTEVVPERVRRGGGYSAALGYDDPYGNGRESFSSRRRYDQPAARYELPAPTRSSSTRRHGRSYDYY
ncbi:hypothetical protein KC343_g2220 [Hortaea werneckii]|uniref:Uncharacterized protein n=1 Tax=Hortaea werneckii TaxID=91943 RepID=A0A3M7G9C5_HORWE|nr:hypothetical protein KC323_g3866 [Hortaea werneckii]KAI6875293.1 hypothetical protein KC338_g783 [Hortaea werneckii]KAI7278515.1 hypothetical protein KC352_g7425 [Hortaea werneckii]KAI7353995.1 hypothetical protein KC320_g3713 [Hortaea werneckii]KAI7560696.1 hypothetical protein KC317_g9561 [Hortaea werneckii]